MLPLSRRRKTETGALQERPRSFTAGLFVSNRLNPRMRRSAADSMTGQQSLDDIRMLLLKYSGVTSANVFRVPGANEVHVRFRCTEINSLRAIAVASVWANVAITLGDPNGRICGEPDVASDLPCDIAIPDSAATSPTHPERLGVYLSENLEAQGLIDLELLKSLHARWNTRLAKRRRKP